MKRRLILLAVGVSVVCALAVGVTTQARAGGNGAEVGGARGIYCLAIDNHGDSWWLSCQVHVVFAPNGVTVNYLTGSVVATGPEGASPEYSTPLPSQAVTDFVGQPCGNFGDVFTSVVAGVVTPSGQVHLTCKS